MNDSELLKISFLASAIGLILLFIVSSSSHPSLVKISEISYDDVGKTVVIKGEIVSKKVHEDGHIFLDVSDDTGKIKVVLFDSLVDKLSEEKGSNLEIGRSIEVKGKVDEYRGSLKIVPKDSEDVRC
jgi:DNA/RNA endonuclease YhcR with UshA esterase domain